MNSYIFLFAQDNETLKKWNILECQDLKNIHTEAECREIWGCGTDSEQYLMSQYNFSDIHLYKLTKNGNEAKLEDIYSTRPVKIYENQNPT